MLPLAAGCTTTITLGKPGSTSTMASGVSAGVVASCQADAKSTETALEAYEAQMGRYPSADAWTDLTTPGTARSGVSVGPWLKSEPASKHYVINFDGNGSVSVDKVGVFTYQAADDIDSRPNVCTTNTS